ncbi:MAG: hypothetical protein C0513_05230 [Isosphaera sp.]|nr:hypothetical protein [Isosphaera sp.]
MSAKWRRIQAWDRAHLTGWLAPLRWVLHGLSTIKLAVGLLVFVALYGTVASVPIGMLALVPTVLLYGVSLVVVAGAVGVLPTLWAAGALRRAGARRGARQGVVAVMFVALSGVGVWAWLAGVWPALRYDQASGRGVRLLAGVVGEYASETVRRLPALEMSELEFYSWWPLRWALLLFVLNLIVATVRRIDLTLPKLGVLMVHSGIVLIGLGSVYYGAAKREGTMLLLAGSARAGGGVAPGRFETGFYDNQLAVLRVSQGRGWEQRPIEGLPRYNAYGLGQGPRGIVPVPAVEGRDGDGGRSLSIEPRRASEGRGLVDADVALRVVGYAPYAVPEPVWAEAGQVGVAGGEPARVLEMLVYGVERGARVGEPGVSSVVLAPGRPAERVLTIGQDDLSVEYTEGMSDERWELLRTAIPGGGLHGLVVEIPDQVGVGGGPVRSVHAVEAGTRLRVGDPAWELEVVSLHARPPLPIVTEGYRDAPSAVAVVRVTPPAGARVAGGPAGRFDRWVYDRVPEVNQEILDGAGPDGRALRRDPIDGIRVWYIDGARVQVRLDRAADGSVRGLVRLPRQAPRQVEALGQGGVIGVGPPLDVRLGRRVERAAQGTVARVVPSPSREPDAVGNHRRAMIAVRVSVTDPGTGAEGWNTVVWVPFAEYFELSPGEAVGVALPDGRRVELGFGRLRHELPGLAVQLTGFTMTPYPHSTVPRDFRSELRLLVGPGAWRVAREHDVAGELAIERALRSAAGVVDAGPAGAGSAGVDQVAVLARATSLNEPLLQGPHVWSGARGALGNALGWLGAYLGPQRYKFSQNGWDAQGWRQSEEAARRGELPGPVARFTILGVGNNPGVQAVAVGAVLMGVGIPWAFYVKPWLARRAKRRVQRALADGSWAGRARAAGGGGAAGRAIGREAAG